MPRIEYAKEEKKEELEGEQGDLIKFNDKTIGYLVVKGNWTNPKCHQSLAVVLLNHSTGDDFSRLAEESQSFFERGEYKVIAKREDWHIVIDKKAGE